MQYHKYSLTEIENMMPWEREIYLALLTDYIESENLKRQQAEVSKGMDEEQEILQSSLEQSDKISIGSFFGSPIGGLANRAILQSNTSLKSSITNRNLIRNSTSKY